LRGTLAHSFAPLVGRGELFRAAFFRHCEERSDEAIQISISAWIASLRSQ